MKKGPTRRDSSPERVAAANERFREEAERYGLAYRCQQCIHLRPEGVQCALGYPNEMLALGEVRALDEEGRFVFCKDFELDD
ncbi:MAG: hypothetical protein FJ109_13575 [Deltaproteobacteria bacterium]|nr:hypothetical protein [Deltaproteobacteria bacterium]